MTRHDAAVALLALGALSFGRFRFITCWPAEDCKRVLTDLQAAGQVFFTGECDDLYTLR